MDTDRIEPPRKPGKKQTKNVIADAALTGICRSGGSVDTLIREFIRVSGCSPIHVRIADSAACHSSRPVSLVKSASICVICG
ncbi:MAG: hypothetical protein ACOYCD_02310 [Kiritimatiellia bacterium]